MAVVLLPDIGLRRGGAVDVSLDALGLPIKGVDFWEFCCLGAACVSCVCGVEKFAGDWLTLLCACGGLFGMWLPFGEVLLDLVNCLVW